MKRIAILIGHIFIIVLLTILTQVGGIIYVISILLNRKWPNKIRFQLLSIFLFLHLAASFLLIPKLAKLAGRERLIHTEYIQPTRFYFDLLNRNYVHTDLNKILLNCSNALASQNADFQIQYLDANFPFLDGFPLIPHLSHDDGKKLDISLIYKDSKSGNNTNQVKSISGYGVFVEPPEHQRSQTNECKQLGYNNYDYSKYFKIAEINKNLLFSNKANKMVIELLLNEPLIEKIFLEDHLCKTIDINHNKLRFQGCHSVRHDDHIHFQIK